VASSAFAFGSAASNTPLLGGVLVPRPELVVPLVLDAGGGASLAFLWPSGVPIGFELWSQAWIVDPQGPQGAAASNALLARAR
jgi:hypothetical protein